jgi:hydrogenase large subunit
MASVRSLDNALETNWATLPAVDMQKITKDDGSTIIPDNGRILRNIIHGADTVMSHITHFYHLAALDFVDVAYLGAPFSPTYSTFAGTLSQLLPGSTPMSNGQPVVSNYVEALIMRRKMTSVGAVFSGRQPISNAIVPGGVTTLPTASDIRVYSNLLDTVRNFINTAYVPDVVTVANAYSTYWTLGTRPGNLLSYGEYPIQRGTNAETLLLARGQVNVSTGAMLTGPPTAFLGNIREFVGYSYYDIGDLKQNDNLVPLNGVTDPDVSLVGSTNQQYSWLKAPRFGTTVCEVGPVARMGASYNRVLLGGPNPVVSGVKSVTSTVPVNGLLSGGTYSLSGLVVAALGLVSQGAGAIVSILGRHATRALECKLLADAMADTGIASTSTGLTPNQAWATELRTGGAADTTGTVFTNLSNPVYVYAKLPTQPKTGSGWAEAPRGALGHWIAIDKKRIANYQCVVPSTWNHSPRDTAGTAGACEQVLQSLSGPLLVALNLQGPDAVYVNILRILHTYDFCIACAVHVVRPDGSTIMKFKMETDGKVTKLPHDAEM